MNPQRIQRKREKGWRAPECSVYVGRGSIWGNPFVVGEPCGVFPEGMGLRGMAETLVPSLTLDQCLEFYRNAVEGYLKPEMYPAGHNWRDHHAKKSGWPSPIPYARTVLRGKTLMCWCALDKPCHADVLLEIANVRSHP